MTDGGGGVDPSGDPPSTVARSDQLVVFGASAGGIEAVSVILNGLKPDFPAPILVAQHLDPDRPTSLPAILQRRTTLPVQLITGPTPLVTGRVYVVPAQQHVVVEDGSVLLESDSGERPRPSIDDLLASAARAYGDRLVAVILSGAGSDGAAGAVEVKAAGGTVVIQNPATARYGSMPSALPPTAVDHMADIEQVGPLLASLLQGPVLAEQHPKAVDMLSGILDHVGRHASIDFRPYKSSSLLRRIGRRMAMTHTTTLEEYARHLEARPAEVAELVMTLLVKVTDFFRDAEAFEFLRSSVFPELIDRGRGRGRTLRLWSAGCATGEEAYSLVMTAADLLGDELPGWNLKVFATDLDEQAVHFARRGLYPPNLLQNVPPDFRRRYFEVVDHGFRVVKPLRQMVIFGQQDLGRAAPFPRIDLVVCRNLLIYFQPELQQEVLDLFAYSLNQTSGYLFLGKAETARPSRATFELTNKKWKVYRCVAPAPHGRLRLPAQAPRVERPLEAANHEPPEIAAPAADVDLGALRRFNELVLRHVPWGLVVIDRGYRIVTTNPAARRLLLMREPLGAADFLHAVRGIPYAEVRSTIDGVFRDRTTAAPGELNMSGGSDDDDRFLNMTIAPLHVDSAHGELVMITVADVTEAVLSKRQLQAARGEHQALKDELTATTKRASDTTVDLPDANEQLQASNEELRLAQEELQATNEEFEATNEELQATNEELETSNEELQATNEELGTTNEELSARSAELHELTAQLSVERARLAEMVELAPFFILVLDGAALVVQAFNPVCGRLLGLDGALKRPLEDVLPDAAELLQGIRGAYRSDQVWTSPATGLQLPGDPHGKHYRMTAVPRHEGRRVSGVIVYAEDVPGA